MWLAGRQKTRRAAWIVGILNQVPWVAYAILAGAWGFIPGSILYAAVYVRNLSLKPTAEPADDVGTTTS